MRKPVTPPRAFTAAAHALADRLERNQRPQSDGAMASKLIRALLAGRAAGEIIVMRDERSRGCSPWHGIRHSVASSGNERFTMRVRTSGSFILTCNSSAKASSLSLTSPSA